MAKGDSGPPGITWAQAVRDVLIASMNRGQFPLALLGAIILSLIWRMPEKEVGILVSRLVQGLENFYLAGYLLFLVTLVGWYIHARRQRRILSEEIERLCNERDKLQGASIGDRVQSSGRRS